MKRAVTFTLLTSLYFSFSSTRSYGSIITTKERFNDFFMTAGYGTAFGAALGASTLPFQANPEKNLKSIAMGASIGFLAGSILGSYVILSPNFEAAQTSLPVGTLISDKGNIEGIYGVWTIDTF